MIETILTKCVALGVMASMCNLVTAAAQKQNISPLLLHAIVKVESHYRPDAVNKVKPGVAIASYGLGQLTLDTAASHCKLGVKNIFDAKKNVECAAKVLAYQLKRYGGDEQLAISAYNSGTVFFNKKGNIKNSDYIERVNQAKY